MLENDETTAAPPAQIPVRGTVAIVGRPNVGKSALFNRLIGRRISIVHDQPGVTRDRLAAVCTRSEIPFELIDTGGIGSVADADFHDQVQAEARLAVETADLILFVVNAQEGAGPVDSLVADLLRRSGKPVFLVVNKIDVDKHESLVDDFARIGFAETIAVSAAHGRGCGELLEKIDSVLARLPEPESTAARTPPLKIAIVGRPNVGKSSLVNALLKNDRTIVSTIAGTTRDSVDIPFLYGDTRYVLVDTAGIRARGRHKTSVEVFSVMRSEKSIQRADLCILVVDAATGVTSQDKKIAGLIQEARKPCVVVLNKWDLVAAELDNKAGKRAMLTETMGRLFFLDYAPVVFLSARTGDYLDRLFRKVEGVRHASRNRITTGVLNRLLEHLLDNVPPPLRGRRRFKILYATQLRDDRPIAPPHYVFFVNDPKLAPENYLRYLEAQIRKVEPYPGLPVQLELRGRDPRDQSAGK